VSGVELSAPTNEKLCMIYLFAIMVIM